MQKIGTLLCAITLTPCRLCAERAPAGEGAEAEPGAAAPEGPPAADRGGLHARGAGERGAREGPAQQAGQRRGPAPLLRLPSAVRQVSGPLPFFFFFFFFTIIVFVCVLLLLFVCGCVCLCV